MSRLEKEIQGYNKRLHVGDTVYAVEPSTSIVRYPIDFLYPDIPSSGKPNLSREPRLVVERGKVLTVNSDSKPLVHFFGRPEGEKNQPIHPKRIFTGPEVSRLARANLPSVLSDLPVETMVREHGDKPPLVGLLGGKVLSRQADEFLVRATTLPDEEK